jgi:hypothetical protein
MQHYLLIIRKAFENFFVGKTGATTFSTTTFCTMTFCLTTLRHEGLIYDAQHNHTLLLC